MVKATINVYLVNSREVYRPGEWIEGVVYVATSSETHARAVRLKVYGRESTSWSEGSSAVGTGSTYWEKYKIFKTYMTLWGYPRGVVGSLQLPRGSLVFPFRVRLPPANLPASGKYRHGRVHYRLKAYIDTVSLFNISVKLDLNVAPALLKIDSVSTGVIVEQEWQCPVGCCIFTGSCYGCLQVRVRCLQPYLVPGKPVRLAVSIVNQSSTEVCGIKLALVHRIEFRADSNKNQCVHTYQRAFYEMCISPSKSFSNMNADATVTETDAGSSERRPLKSSELEPFILQVPAVLPSTFNGHLITSLLEVKFTVHLSDCCATNPVVSLPVDAASECIVRNSLNSDVAMPNLRYVPVQIRSDSKVGHQLCFSFDGMQYNPSDQFGNKNPVAYPYFYDCESGVIPSSLGKFNASWLRQLQDTLAFERDEDNEEV